MNNFKFVCCDTDSITFCKPDGAPFSDEEQKTLFSSINSVFPAHINWEQEGPYDKIIILKAKNYILYEKGKIKTKGSALKSSRAEIAFREMQQEIIASIIHDKKDYTEIYNKHVKAIFSITKENIKRYCSKRTYTSKIDDSERTNETKVKDAIAGTNYKEGDKFFVIFKSDGSLVLMENFIGEYDAIKLLEKLYKSTAIFDSVLPTEELFINYKLKKNKKLLDALLIS